MKNLEFDHTVKRYIGMLYRIAFNYLKSKEDSEDAVQNTFIRLFRYGKSFTLNNPDEGILVFE